MRVLLWSGVRVLLWGGGRDTSLEWGESTSLGCGEGSILLWSGVHEEFFLFGEVLIYPAPTTIHCICMCMH